MKTFEFVAPSEFQLAMIKNIREYIKRARRTGTTAMGQASLLQCVPTPSQYLPGAPVGTYAARTYSVMFAAACELKGIREFILS